MGRMCGQKGTHQWANLLAGILQEVMASARKFVYDRFWKPCLPGRKEVGVENEVAFTPTNQHREVA